MHTYRIVNIRTLRVHTEHQTPQAVATFLWGKRIKDWVIYKDGDSHAFRLWEVCKGKPEVTHIARCIARM